MALRPGRCYHKISQKPYTRVAVHVPKKSYVKGVPGSKIRQFETGKKSDYPLVFSIVSGKATAMRSNCLEAARVAATKYLSTKLSGQFFLKLRIFPHHVMRENPLATGAGADRFSSGMRRSFGKPIGYAARVKENQKVISVFVPDGKEDIAKEALRRAARKLPGACKIVAG